MLNAQMATVTGFKTGDFLNLGEQLIAQIKIEDDNDVQDCLIISPSGDESAPQKDDRIPVIPIGNFYLSIGGTDSVSPTIETGEKLLYSRDSDGELSAFIRFLSDGVLKINGEGDFLARFDELKSGFDELKTDLNNHITNWNTFAAAYSPGGPSVVGSPAAAVSSSQSSASVDSAKIEELEVSDAS